MIWRRDVSCNVALFSLDENIQELRQCNVWGNYCCIRNGYVNICRGEWKMRVMRAADIPITFGGKAEFMIQNVMGAVLAANIQGVSIEDMKAALETFIPSAAQTPGRLNMFEFNKFRVLLDYAHNPAGMLALKKLTDNLEATVKVGIIAGIGDRRVEDNNEIGKVASSMFDEIIIRQDKKLRGRTEGELIKMLEDGIKMHDPNKKVTIIPSERDAIIYAVENAIEGSLIVLSSDVIPDALDLVKELKEKEANGELVLNN